MNTIKGAGELQQIDPRDLQLEDNVRAEASLTKDFIASVRELGVLMPVIAVRNPDGGLLVRAGQRRTAAAREAGLSAIPVYITDEGTDDASRLVTQIVENDQRLGLNANDRTLGIHALIDTGMSVTKVAKRLSIPAAQVKKTSAVARSKAALEAMQRESLTLDQAAEIAEFEDDPEVVEILIGAAKRNYFDHELARQKSEREYQKRHAEAAEAYTKRGVTVLDRRPDYDDNTIVSEYSLVDANGDELSREAIVASVEANPQAWSVSLSEESLYTDSEGNAIEESKIDWATEDDPDSEPEEGFFHADSVKETTVFVADQYYCLDPEAVGLAVSERFLRRTGGSQGDATPTIAQREAEKRERRKVLALNKAGDTAQGVRRAFVTGLLQRKTAPKGSALFVARMLSADPSLLSGYTAVTTAAELGISAGELEGEVSKVLTTLAVDLIVEARVVGLEVGTFKQKSNLGQLGENQSTTRGSKCEPASRIWLAMMSRSLMC
jgi:ParB family chromosome partitioning protein